MSTIDIVIIFFTTIVLIIGIYQFYFLPQKHPLKDAITFTTKIDDYIPFHPQWVWIYSGLYYPIIISLMLAFDSFKEFNYVVFSFFCLLVAQLVFFYFFPVKTPSPWRDFEKNTPSKKFLSFVHSFDGDTNCFPSMHVSVATLTALYLSDLTTLGSITMLFPLLIALSAVFTKQHYLVDTIAGYLLGWAIFTYLNFL